MIPTGFTDKVSNFKLVFELENTCFSEKQYLFIKFVETY